jgi:hypothetical protein
MANENLEEKVWVKSLVGWNLGFSRIESQGSVQLTANGRIRLTKAEIQAQVFNGSKFFGGTDGRGTHARIYIEDKDTRVLVGFEDEESKEVQKVLDEEIVGKLLAYKTQSTFEKRIKEEVVTKAEKNFLVEQAKKAKLNDYDKIKFIEDYTGYKFDNK